MPRAVFVKSCPVGRSFRVEKVKGVFDLDSVSEVRREYDVDIPIEEKPWSIGLIVGSSGSGKTTIARECFPDFLFFTGFEWAADSMLDDFPAECSVDEITTACGHVGLSSAPDWLKPFSVLSNGQKMRAELARLFLAERNRPVIYDEFTSVVDRQVAQVSSYAISKFIRRNGQQFVAVSCHRDIEEWLNPDWVYDTDQMQFRWRCLRRKPDIQLDLREGAESEWALFRPYHYLSAEHNKAARKVVAEYKGVPVAWCSWLHFAHPTLKNMKRIHRLVVRPDYQGLGIGKALLNAVASKIQGDGYRLSIVTSLGVFAKAMSKDASWRLTRQGFLTGGTRRAKKGLREVRSCRRLTASFEYVGNGAERGG